MQAQGLFAPAYALRDGSCPVGFEHWLDETLEWLDEYLYAPDVWEPRAIFWMRADWQVVVEKLWALAVILREAGEGVQMLTTARPGYVVYEDFCQVAAIPFRDTFGDSRRR